MSAAVIASYVLLWALVLIELIGLASLFRHFGRIYVATREGRADHGPKVGGNVSQLLRGLRTRSLDLAGRPSLVLFVGLKCAPCARLREQLPRGDYGDSEVVIVCAGTARECNEWQNGLPRDFRLVPDPAAEIGDRLGVQLTPFVIAFDSGGIVRAKGVVNEVESLERLAEAISDSRPTRSRALEGVQR